MSCLCNGIQLLFTIMMSKSISLLMLTLVLTEDSLSQSGQHYESLTLVCPSLPVVVRSRSDYIYTPGIGAHKLHKDPLPWNIARKICMTEGAHLAIINSEAEAQKLSKLFEAVTENINGSDNLGFAWLGFHDLFEQRDFVTVHGDPLVATGYSNWMLGEPNGGPEHCGSMSKQARLNDYICHHNVIFFCEIPSTVLSVDCNS